MGDWYAFEKGAEKTAGGDGLADVRKRGHFSSKVQGQAQGPGRAYKQLLDYREALENPPLARGGSATTHDTVVDRM